ncbi:hypothetical protein AAG570_010456 [Ranatra chinensis]|uniref:Uncharacterized protein n=1 Tax=Ranatra chinensis TaxID=642074 RepID=A0ABD0YN14_9HEMI
MFNVSIVNNAPNGGPVKPARTYRSNLLRSKSFNVHQAPPGPGHHWASPGVQRLEGGHAPLKSPGIVTSISRSTKDLAEALHQEGQNGLHSRNNVDSKKKIFMKALMERAPELYRTLHGPEEEVHQRNGTSYTTSTPVKQSYHYRSSPTHLDRVHSPTGYNMSNGSATDLSRSVVRRGSNDYTETVTFTKKSDDPNRPTVTNTVQSYTKKMVPTPGGGTRRETIESTETKTVTKSRFRTATPELKYLEHDPNKYSTGNGGVIIEVRNTRK